MSQIITKEQFENKCYHAYQLDWMISHGYSLNDYMKNITDISGMLLEENTFSLMPINTEGMYDLMKETNQQFQNTGFDGSLFACKDEFLETEYLDKDYMQHLLSSMKQSVLYQSLWEQFTELKLDETLSLEESKTYILSIKDGRLEITQSLDSDYPGVYVEYVPENKAENDDSVNPCILMEYNKNIDLLRTIIWSDPVSEDPSYFINFACTDNKKKGE